MRADDLDVKLGKILHSIGLFSVSIVVLTLIALSLINFKLVNRLSLRLIFTLCIADFSVHLSELLGLGSDYLLGSKKCEFLSTFRYFGRLLYCLTNILISWHLYRSIILLKQSTFKLELISWLIMIFIILIIMIIFGYLGVYNGINKLECRPSSDNLLFFDIEEGLIGLLSIITLLTCFTTFLIGRREFIKSITHYAELHITDQIEREKFLIKRKRMVERSFLYPLGTLITLPTPIALSVMDLIHHYTYPIYVALAISQGLSGILTFLAFILDPAVWSSIKLAKYKLMKKSKDNQIIHNLPIIDDNFV